MQNFEKLLRVTAALVNHPKLLAGAQRVELKRTKSGHGRIYIALGIGIKPVDAHALAAELSTDGVSLNPFVKAGALTAITIVDDDEDTVNG